MTDFKVDIGDEVYKIKLLSSFPTVAYDKFTDLSDTPDTYLGQGGLLPRVNSVEDSLEFFQPGVTDLDPKDHHLLDGLSDDDHPLYLRHDGIREITGTLLPATTNTHNLGSSDQQFNYICTNTLAGNGGLEITTGGPLAAEVYDLTLSPRGKVINDVTTEFNKLTIFNDNLDWSGGTEKPHIYVGGVEPDIPTDNWGFWYDDINDQDWIILDRGGVQKRVELK